MSGLRNPAVAALMRGMTVLVPAPGMKHPLQIYSLLSRDNVTHLSTVPSLMVNLERMKNSLAAEQRPQSLQQILTTGYSIPAATRAHLEQFLNVPVYSYYGLTETGGICLADSTGLCAEGDLGITAGSIAQIRDPAGNILGPGHAGELCIYSVARATGYWGGDVASSVEFHNGWVHTGDIVELAIDGSFHYIGRRDDQVKNRWGEIMYLQEVERAASTLEAVMDSCCAIHAGQSGELDTLVLFVVGSDALMEAPLITALYAQLQKILGAHKLPERIVSVPAIARFSSTKPDRKSMLAQYYDQENYA
jgi:acyl-coenzyme A synthetase/AMP-(fatty) acid ligase